MTKTPRADCRGRPVEGSIHLVRRLRAAGFPLYGLANFSSEKSKIPMKKFRFLEFFHWIMISGKFSLPKPDPRLVEVFLERTGRPISKHPRLKEIS